MAPSYRSPREHTQDELERRRLAIADALREVMAESTSPPSKVTAEEPSATAGAESDDEVDERVSVPPFGPADVMSADASRALFGDR